MRPERSGAIENRDSLPAWVMNKAAGRLSPAYDILIVLPAGRPDKTPAHRQGYFS